MLSDRLEEDSCPRIVDRVGDRDQEEVCDQRPAQVDGDGFLAAGRYPCCRRCR